MKRQKLSLQNTFKYWKRIQKARLEYQRVAQTKDSDWSPAALQILTQIEGKSDNSPVITTKYLFHMQIVPNPARIWRYLKLWINRRLKRHKFIPSHFTEADFINSIEAKKNLYYLKCEGVLLGLLKLDQFDFPWVYCHFQPTPAFEDVKPRFGEEINIAGTDPKSWEAWYDNNIKILDLHLIDAASDQEVKYSILHIQNITAWFRPSK